LQQQSLPHHFLPYFSLAQLLTYFPKYNSSKYFLNTGMDIVFKHVQIETQKGKRNSHERFEKTVKYFDNYFVYLELLCCA
jgi:CRISPR/Cas system-associated protein Csx1